MINKGIFIVQLKCVSLRPFGVFYGFFGLFGPKTGFRAATQLFWSPFFLFSGQKSVYLLGVLYTNKDRPKGLTA